MAAICHNPSDAPPGPSAVAFKPHLRRIPSVSPSGMSKAVIRNDLKGKTAFMS